MRGDRWSWPFFFAEILFLIVFFIEISSRLWAERPAYINFFDGWGCFDTMITILGTIDVVMAAMAEFSSIMGENPMASFTVLRMFRLIRLVRLIRVVRMFRELVQLVQTIGTSLRAVSWMSVLLGLIVYTSSIVTVLLVGIPHRDDDEAVEEFFGSMGSSLFAHFCIVTLENWPDVVMAAMNHHTLWVVYFVVLIIITNFALVNMMVGVIAERIISQSLEADNELASFIAESEQFKLTLHSLFRKADMDSTGTLSKKEIRDLLDDATTHEIMNIFGINLSLPHNVLYTIMDIDHDGETSFEDFFDACMRLCGSKQNVHSVCVQHSICECHREVTSCLDALSNDLDRIAAGKPLHDEPADVREEGPCAEETLRQLLARMDRFGKVQQSMVAEMHSLGEAEPRFLLGGDALLSRSSADIAGRPTVVVEKAGRELGDLCRLDTFFSQRRAGLPLASSPAPPLLCSDPQALRRGLVKEYREKKGS